MPWRRPFSGFGLASVSASGSRGAGEESARCLADVDDDLPHRALILLTDGLAGEPQDVGRGAYSVAGATVSLVGGCGEAQLHSDRGLRGSVVAAALSSEAPFGVGVRHGWRPRADPLLITASEGKRLQAINDRPALDVYLELAEGAGVTDDFRHFALLHPLGVAAARGARPRSVRGRRRLPVALSCNATPSCPGTLVWPMDGVAEEVLNATSRAS